MLNQIDKSKIKEFLPIIRKVHLGFKGGSDYADNRRAYTQNF